MGLGAHKQQLSMLPTAYFEVLEILPAARGRPNNTRIVGLYLEHVRLPRWLDYFQVTHSDARTTTPWRRAMKARLQCAVWNQPTVHSDGVSPFLL